MTYKNLLKWKEYYTRKNDLKNLAKINKNLEKYSPVEEKNILEKIADNKVKK